MSFLVLDVLLVGGKAVMKEEKPRRKRNSLLRFWWLSMLLMEFVIILQPAAQGFCARAADKALKPFTDSYILKPWLLTHMF